MGPPQRIAGPAPTAFSQDPLWVCLREQNSLVKNRMRGIRTSGSVRGGDGNVPTYSALARGQGGERGGKGGRVGPVGERAGEAQRAAGEGDAQLLHKEVAIAAREHAHRQEEAGPAGDPPGLVGGDATARDDVM